MSVKDASATTVAALFSSVPFVYDDDEKRVKSIFNRMLFVLSATIAGLVMACNALTQMLQFESIPAKQLQFPNADYYSIAIVQGKLIAFQQGEKNNEWLYANEADQNLHQIVLLKISTVHLDQYMKLVKLSLMGAFSFGNYVEKGLPNPR